ncbi:MAG: hypothetical protein ACJ786_19045 [Catenulispora sp.]
MAEDFVPADWAVSRFGRENAIMLASLIPQAVQDAVVRQMDAHHASKQKTLHTYVGTWPIKYEEIANRLIAVPGAQVAKPPGHSVEIVLVNNVAVVPFEYAKDAETRIDDHRVMDKLNVLTEKLLEQYGPEPEFIQPVLDGFSIGDDTGSTEPELLPGFEPDGVVIVFYAADPYGGLLRIGWGEAEIGISNRPVWVPRKQQDLLLPTAKPRTDASDKGATVLPAHVDQGRTRFYEGPEPIPNLSARTKSERLNLDPVTAEPPQEDPLAHDQE